MKASKDFPQYPAATKKVAGRTQFARDQERHVAKMARREVEARRLAEGGLSRWGIATACWWCGRSVKYDGDMTDPLRATREHLLPKSFGGTRQKDNIVVACQQCNGARGTSTDWVAFAVVSALVYKVPTKQWMHLVALNRITEEQALRRSGGGNQ